MTKDRFPRQMLLGNDNFKVIPMAAFKDQLSQLPHRHDHFTIMWISSGHGFHEIDGQQFDLATNRVFFIRPGQLHKMSDFERDGFMVIFSELVYKQLESSFPFSKSFSLDDIDTNKPFMDLSVLQSEEFNILIHLTEKALSRNAFFPVIFSYVLSLMAIFRSNYLLPKAKKEELLEDKDIMLSIRKSLDKDYALQHKADYYADQFHITARRLNNILLRHCGQTYHELLMDKLMLESKILLGNDSINIKELSYNMGFSDPAYFNRFFKKRQNMSPLQYRKRYQE